MNYSKTIRARKNLQPGLESASPIRSEEFIQVCDDI